MKTLLNINEIQSIIEPASSILVVLPQKVNHDKVASALALYLALTKNNKKVDIVCSRPMTVEFSNLVGVDKVSQSLAGNNLVISFDYQQDSIEKVSYHIEDNKFNLVVQPKENFPPLSPEKVSYSFAGGQGDAVIVLGAGSFNDLGEIYFKNKDFFDNSQSIVLDIYPNNNQFGKINLVDSEISCYAEMVTNLLVALGLQVDEDIATNLMQGIDRATGIFTSPKVGSDTFEAASLCLRAGARRMIKKITEAVRVKEPLQPMPAEVSAQTSPEEKPEEKPAPDWFEPKIYKGNTVV